MSQSKFEVGDNHPFDSYNKHQRAIGRDSNHGVDDNAVFSAGVVLVCICLVAAILAGVAFFR